MRSAREQREKLPSGDFYNHARLRFLPCGHARPACDSRGARHATGAGLAPLERWCRLYREGGAEALEPKPKGRPKGSRSKPRERTREQELEERCRRLETEIAYLKKLRALVERDGL